MSHPKLTPEERAGAFEARRGPGCTCDAHDAPSERCSTKTMRCQGAIDAHFAAKRAATEKKMNDQIGPRQTVDRAKHPTLGEGRAVHENGPAIFIPDSGEPVPMRRIGFGGSSSGPPSRSWLVAVTMTGERVELETTGLEHGDSHKRRWSPIFGPGWLVYEAWPVYPGDGASKADKARYNAARAWMRFEPDDGSKPIRWQWNEMHVGRLKGNKRPAYPKNGAPKSAALIEWNEWTTIESLEFRNEPPAGAAGSATADKPWQPTLPGFGP